MVVERKRVVVTEMGWGWGWYLGRHGLILEGCARQRGEKGAEGAEQRRSHLKQVMEDLLTEEAWA